MPSRLNEDDAPAGLQTGVEVGLVPVPCFVADQLGVGVFTASDGVVNNHQISSPTGDCSTNASGEVLPACAGLPSTGSLTVGSKPDTEHQLVFAEQVPDTPPPFLCQLSRMARRDQAMRRMLRVVPRREQDARIRALGGAGRHEHRQPVNLAPRYSLELLDQQQMMPRRLKARVPAPVS